MSYCRFSSGSDLYMYASIDGGYIFHIAGDLDGGFKIEEAASALDKMIELKAEGLKIPDSAFERLEEEILSGKFDK